MTRATDGRAFVTMQVLESIRRIIRAVDVHSKALVQQYRLTSPQLVVLKAAAEGHYMSTSELAEAVHISQATITGILDRLEARGLVVRTRSRDDRRRVAVSVSPAGQELLERAPPLLQEGFVERFLRLEDWEQSQILAALQRIVGLMEAGDIDATAVLATGALGSSEEQAAAVHAMETPGASEPSDDGASEVDGPKAGRARTGQQRGP